MNRIHASKSAVTQPTVEATFELPRTLCRWIESVAGKQTPGEFIARLLKESMAAETNARTAPAEVEWRAGEVILRGGVTNQFKVIAERKGRPAGELLLDVIEQYIGKRGVK